MASADFKRNIQVYAADLLQNFPVLAIIGARQVGRTTLTKKIAPDFTYMDLESAADYDRITHDPAFFFKQYPEKVIIDEAQLHSALFPILRGVVDDNRQKKGRFIITGSSAPELLENISESLAGRIAILELGTLKANERYQKPLSDFYKLFENTLEKNLSINSKPLTLDQGFSFEAFVIEEILKGLQDARHRNVDYYFYRTRSGSEIDLILDGSFGLLPIEIKLGSSVPRRQLKSLTEFIETNECAYGIVINQSDEIEWLT